MSRKQKTRRGYHHGNLRAALVEAALSLIGDKGVAGFTVAEAARKAGVSPAAPYRHFKDRDALLADVAIEGFSAFDKALKAAWNTGKPDAYTALITMGHAYLDFAKSEPAFYSAMFESGLEPPEYPDLRAAADTAFETLRTAVELLIYEMPAETKPPALMVSLHIWAMSHGIASLFNRGDGASRRQPIEPGELFEANLMIYLRGLGLEI
ncbi:MAG: TetR/AcrR family transcriptional regulator [Hyphomicrobiales bacterium]